MRRVYFTSLVEDQYRNSADRVKIYTDEDGVERIEISNPFNEKLTLFAQKTDPLDKPEQEDSKNDNIIYQAFNEFGEEFNSFHQELGDKIYELYDYAASRVPLPDDHCEIIDNENNLYTKINYNCENEEEILSESMYFKADSSDGSTKYIFKDGNSVEIKNDNTAIVSRGSLSQELKFRLNQNGSYSYGDDTYALKDSLAEVLNQTELEINDSYDGVISAAFQGNGSGDCYLLCGVETLSYAKQGAQIIKDALTYNEDGSIDVYFKGVDKTYTVSKSDLDNIKYYSEGDKDMLAIELATKQVMAEVSSCKLKLTQDAPYYIKSTDLLWYDYPLIKGGWPGQIWYLFTGRESSSDYYDGYPTKYSKETMNQLYAEFEQNKDKAISFVTGQAITTSVRNNHTGVSCGAVGFNDIFNQPQGLVYFHTYGLKDAVSNGDGTYTLTIVNPWDSSNELTINSDELYNKTSYQCFLDFNQETQYPKYYYRDN